MSGHRNSGYQSESSLGIRVAAWKAEVVSYFSNDWSRLRSLMMEMEECNWNDSANADTASGMSDLKCLNSDSPVTLGSTHPQSNTGERCSEPRPAQDERLTELAKQIERRLQSSAGNGR